MLLDRQATTRRNIAVMFANIGRRTQNLAGRQLALIEDIERNERDPEMLTRLYRLDHVATRLRRSADSLLVVSGTIEQLMSGHPTHLADVLRSALGEIEGFQAVEFGQIPDVAVSAGLVADLRLLVAELLENATNFSPPGTPVRVSAAMHEDACAVFVVDHGIGMGPARLEEENRRLVERERLDLAPTTMLGLFVVGRLARRHGLSVRLDLSDGKGITATVRIPDRLLTAAAMAPPRSIAAGPRPAVVEPVQADDETTGPFDWFTPGPVDAGATVAPVSAPVHVPLPRREPVPEPAPTVNGVPAPTRAGLTRRVPGTHMAEAFRESEPEETTVRIVRDPEAERDAVNDFLAGLARGGDTEGVHTSIHPAAERHT